MGHKIFVSYKYGDNDVQSLPGYLNTIVRDYVTEFQKKVDASDDINKGEKDNEDLSQLEDDTIWEYLRDRIYDSSVTIVFISPNMREKEKTDRDQWIPWEISYSLSEYSRNTKTGKSVTSKSNAMLAVVLPDSHGKYDYFREQLYCCSAQCVRLHTEHLFTILRKNMFNLIDATKRKCTTTGDVIWNGESSYIETVRWCDFIRDYSTYVDLAIKRQDRIDEYTIVKKV